MIGNFFKKGLLLFGSFFALGNVFQLVSTPQSLPKTSEELAQKFVQSWTEKHLLHLSSLFTDEIYLAVAEEHQKFSRSQSVALLQKYFDQITIQEMVLEKVHPKYLLFKQTSFMNGKPEICQIFLGYQRSNEVLKIVRVEKE